tara:strand:+ start:4295 stop:4435 length:141 start_codon:yes stop_codon:yes gene_type:complete
MFLNYVEINIQLQQPKKYVMDKGLLIALITLLGGGFIIILKKKRSD